MYHIFKVTGADWAEVVSAAGPRSKTRLKRAGPKARRTRARAKRDIRDIPLESDFSFESALKDGISVFLSMMAVKDRDGQF
jgi:hypothetical protein